MKNVEESYLVICKKINFTDDTAMKKYVTFSLGKENIFQVWESTLLKIHFIIVISVKVFSGTSSLFFFLNMSCIISDLSALRSVRFLRIRKSGYFALTDKSHNVVSGKLEA